MKFWTTVYLQSQLATFLKNRFPNIFGGHLEFLHKMQKHIYLRESVRENDFDEIFDHRVSAESTGDFCQNSFSCHFFRPISNFCVKRKNTFFSGTMQDSAISAKFLTPNVSAK